jgi:hypothetical protein
LRAGAPLTDQHDACGIERADKFHERINIPPNYALARLHALDSRKRQSRQLAQFALVDPKECARGTQLSGSDQMPIQRGVAVRITFNTFE